MKLQKAAPQAVTQKKTAPQKDEGASQKVAEVAPVDQNSSSPRMSKNETRIYIGNLPPDIRNKDIEDLFYKYGKIQFIDLKNRRGPPFAFVEFDDPRDADDAVYARDGYDYDGYKLRVEFPRGGGGSFRGSRDGGGRSSRFGR